MPDIQAARLIIPVASPGARQTTQQLRQFENQTRRTGRGIRDVGTNARLQDKQRNS
jgi:hypothetical protein